MNLRMNFGRPATSLGTNSEKKHPGLKKSHSISQLTGKKIRQQTGNPLPSSESEPINKPISISDPILIRDSCYNCSTIAIENALKSRNSLSEKVVKEQRGKSLPKIPSAEKETVLESIASQPITESYPSLWQKNFEKSKAVREKQIRLMAKSLSQIMTGNLSIIDNNTNNAETRRLLSFYTQYAALTADEQILFAESFRDAHNGAINEEKCNAFDKASKNIKTIECHISISKNQLTSIHQKIREYVTKSSATPQKKTMSP